MTQPPMTQPSLGQTMPSSDQADAERRLAGITAHLPGVVFQRLLGVDGHFSYPFISEGVQDLLGYAPAEMGMTTEGLPDAVHWADRAPLLAVLRQSAATMSPCTEEFRAISKSGEVHWLRGGSRPLVQDDGAIVWDGVWLDVTDRKRAELRLQTIMDHAADSIVTIDHGGMIQSVNAAAADLFGYSAAELEGNPVSMLMPEPYRSQHGQFMERYLERSESKLIGAGPREMVGMRKDGSQFPFEIAVSEVRNEGRLLFIGIGRDITKRKQTEAALRESEQRLRSVASNVPGLVFQRVMRPDGGISFPYISEACRELLGIEPEALMQNGSLFLDCVIEAQREEYLARMRRSFRTLEPMESDIAMRPMGRSEVIWLRGRSRPRALADGSVVWEGLFLDVTDRHRAEEQLNFLAYFDSLTGAANRSLLLERFTAAAIKAKDEGKLVAMLSLGIDRFGIFNSTLGHAAGDQLLVELADRLRLRLGDGDTLARLGDGFMIMLTGLSGEAETHARAEALLACRQELFHVGGEEVELDASIGISLYPQDGAEGENLIRNAEAALLRAKAAGPGTVQRFDLEMNAAAIRAISLQKRMRRALDRREFVPYFQPQVDLISGAVVGMEALVRWISAEGITPPSEFIPVAEQSGMIDDIFEQMLTRCCDQLCEWRDQGLPLVPVAVNVSGRQFCQPRRLVQLLETVLTETGLPPHLLELELTESSAMSDPDSAISVVSMLRSRGISCSIDDFGTGYSSLSVLKRFPIYKLKIDRSFVMDIATDPNDAAIVSAIVAMARALKLKVVAEGVEALSHLEFLRDLGCDQIQGYLFSRPLPAQEMAALLASGRRLGM